MPRTGLTAKALREKALDTAEKIICKTGAGKFRLTDVARRLEVSHAALYKHFADKESLLDGVSRRWLDGIDRELAAIAAKTSTTGERLTNWFLALHRLKRQKILSEPELYAVFGTAADRMRPFVENHLRTAIQQLESMISSGMDNGELRKGDPKAVAMLLFEATAAFHHPRLVHEGIHRDRTKALKSILSTLIAGLR